MICACQHPINCLLPAPKTTFNTATATHAQPLSAKQRPALSLSPREDTRPSSTFSDTSQYVTQCAGSFCCPHWHGQMTEHHRGMTHLLTSPQNYAQHTTFRTLSYHRTSLRLNAPCTVTAPPQRCVLTTLCVLWLSCTKCMCH